MDVLSGPLNDILYATTPSWVSNGALQVNFPVRNHGSRNAVGIVAEYYTTYNIPRIFYSLANRNNQQEFDTTIFIKTFVLLPYEKSTFTYTDPYAHIIWNSRGPRLFSWKPTEAEVRSSSDTFQNQSFLIHPSTCGGGCTHMQSWGSESRQSLQLHSRLLRTNKFYDMTN